MLLNEENIRTLTQLTQVGFTSEVSGSILLSFAGILVGIPSRHPRLDRSDEHIRENLFCAHTVLESSIQTGSITLLETRSMETLDFA